MRQWRRSRLDWGSLGGMVRLAHALALTCFLRQCGAFHPVGAPPSPAVSSSFRQPSTLTTCCGRAASATSPRRLVPSASLACPTPPQAARLHSSNNPGDACRPEGHRNRRYRRRDDGTEWRLRRRPSLTSLSAVREGTSSSSSAPAPAGQDQLEGEEVGWGLPASREPEPGGSRETKNKGGGEEGGKPVLEKAGNALKAAFNAFMAASTLASLVLAAEAVWQLHGAPLTLSNAVPTLTKLLPLTGIGVFGAAQLVGLVARVVRVIVTLPVMVSGTWVILQNAPKQTRGR
ncbi:hypothetical protein Esi_0035_0132 [Ectocarpus siliculosus]|uniref:Uncharacterized protein n=1 Tax=Ectocarpus siliculosus TaxID=2880 RepID=D7FYX7_ECTSI|nr:hypothetical protein Esi_0035_0132 [Ectocarpus siliculosus]|eukprot:CBJ26619.1 hypothetical protein Esi_0035_0132 [Ectocarpus siliculosus]